MRDTIRRVGPEGFICTVLGLPVVVGALLLVPQWLRPEAEPILLSEVSRPEAVASPAADAPDGLPMDSLHVPRVGEVEPGQTLSGVFADLGLDAATAVAAVDAVAEHFDVRRLRAGATYRAWLTRTGRLAAWQLPVGDEGKLRLERSEADGAWTAHMVPYQDRVEGRVVEGRLARSLVASLDEAGGPGRLAYRMADVLQWDLDFTRDLRAGDRFQVLFEEIWRDGRLHGVGDVVALRYVNAGRVIEAYRFGADDGYYDGEGRPLRKMFLRSPMRYTRVTSRFSHRRFHPVLKKYRPHYGVDYGAPVGTPVRVTASGVVTFAGRNGGAGNMVKVRHPNGYLSAYLHLSGYARGIRSGARVAQGDVVGYVGSTGLSTGPHLDYRVQKNGRWIDPLSIESVPAEPIPDDLRADFEAFRDSARTALELGLPLEDARGGETRVAESPGPAPGATSSLPPVAGR